MPNELVTNGDSANGRTVFDDISPTAWEHPSDRVALNALRELRGFDTVLRKLVGLLGEKQLRLAFRANAVRVGEKQYPWVHEALMRGCEVLDVDEPPQLYVAQTPIANAGAYGLDKPFIILNSSLIEVLGPEETEAVIGHELGHVISGHALYRTMLYILLEQTSLIQWTPASIAIRPVVLALLEWSRKAEVSCDRAGLLVVQDPRVSMSALMKLAGGTRGEDLDVDEFIRQSDEYLEEQGFLDRTYKTLSLLGATHPFAVLRVAELRRWIDDGGYDRILGGDYRRRSDDAPPPYRDDLAEAGQGYAAKAEEFIDSAETALLGMVDRISDLFSSDDPVAPDGQDDPAAPDDPETQRP